MRKRVLHISRSVLYDVSVVAAVQVFRRFVIIDLLIDISSYFILKSVTLVGL
jgi:hypothetical protein